MAMTYTSLTAAKGTAGAIATWVNYTKLDVATILDEAQILIYQTLRTREMRVSATVTLSSGQSLTALPGASQGQFLEPVTLRDTVNNLTFIPNDERFVSQEKLWEKRVYTGGILASGTPGYVSIFDESFQFDVRSSSTIGYSLVYYQRPPLLASGTNESNWLTNRYPHLVRTACMAAAADFMKDTEEYNKLVTRLGQIIDAINKEHNLTDSKTLASVNDDRNESSLLSFLNPSTVPVQAILAEAQALIFSRLRAREMMVSTSLTLSAGATTMALPLASSGQFLEPITLHDDTNDLKLIPSDEKFVSHQRLLQLRNYVGGVLTTGTPTYVAIFDENFNFDVKAAAQTSYTLVYYQRPTNLTDRSQTSWLTLRYPHLLRVAAQAALADFQKDAAGHAEAVQRLNGLIDQANAEAKLIDDRGVTSDINKAPIEGSLLNFISEQSVPVQAILAEAQAIIYSKLRVREMMVSTSFVLSGSANHFTLPGSATGDFLEPITLHDDTNSTAFIPSDERYVSEQRLLQVRTNADASPLHVSIFNEAFQFDTAPLTTPVSYTLVYYQRPSFLTAVTQSNFLSLRYPHILRAGAQVALANFKHDAEARTAALATLDALVDIANKEAQLVTARGTKSALTDPTIEGSLLSFVSESNVPAQAILAEAQAIAYSKLRVREMRQTTTLSLTTGLNSIPLPGAAQGNFLEPITLHDDTNGVALIPNDEKFVSERRLLQLRTAVNGIPAHVSIFGEAFQFDVPASGTTSYTLVYYQRPAALTSPSSTNWFTLRYPHILRAAVQVALANFKRDPEGRAAAMQSLDALVEVANKEADLDNIRGTRSDLTLPGVESSLLSFVPDTTVPVQAILTETQALIYSKLRVREMRQSTTLSLTVGVNNVALPGAAQGNFLEPITLHDDTNSVALIPSDERFVSEQKLLQIRTATNGIPAHVSIFNEAFQFDCPASGTMNYTLVYYQRPTFLTTPNASNFLTLRYPQIVRAAAQVALANFKHDAEARNAAMATLDALIEIANNEADLVTARGTKSEISTPTVESTLLNFIPEGTMPVQAMLSEAQAIVYSKLRVREMRQSASLASTLSVNNIALPGATQGNFLEVITLHDDTNSVALIPSDERFLSERRLLQVRTNVNGVPGHVSIFNEAFQFDCPANGVINYTVVYYQRPAFLTSPSSSNFLTARYPHILRAAAQVALANFKHDAAARDAAMATLNALTEEANKEAELVTTRGTKSDLTLPAVESSLLSFVPENTVPVQVILAETQALIFSKLRVREMRASTTFTLTTGVNNSVLPGSATGDFLEPVTLHDDTNAIMHIPSDERFVSEQRLLQLRTNVNAIPQHVSIFNESFQFDTPAAGTYTYSLVYYKRPTFLTSPSASNWLTLRYPQIFRAAAEVSLANFKHDAAARTAAMQTLDALIEVANKEAELLTVRGTKSDLTLPALDGSLISFVPDNSVPAQQILQEAQAIAYSKLRVREMRQSQTLALTTGVNNVALPGAAQGNFLEVITLHDDTNGVALIPNDERFVSERRLLQLRTATAGPPQHVSIFNEAFQFDCPSSGTTNYTVVFYQRPTFLTAPSSSNWFTLRYPHIFRAAAQVALANFKRDAAARTAALQALDALVEVANKEADLPAVRGTQSELTAPSVESTLLNFIPEGTVPAQAILFEAQALAYARLRVREMWTSTSLTLLLGTNTIALPGAANGDFLEPIALYDATGTTTFIPSDQRYVSHQRMLQLIGATPASGVPAHVSIYNENLVFDLNASPAQTFTLVYYKRPTFLTSPASSNWLTLRYPQILRAAAQVAIADFKHDTKAYTENLARLDALCQAANDEAKRLDDGFSQLNKPAIEGSLLSLIGSTTTPVQAVLAETQAIIFSKLRVREMRQSTTLALTTGLNSLALPGAATGDFLEPITLHDDTNNVALIPNDERFVSERRLLQLRTAVAGAPQHVAIFGESFQFDSPSSGTTNYTLVYYGRPAFLTTQDSSNWLTLRYPQIFRAGAEVALANMRHDAAARTAALQTLDALVEIANKEADLVNVRGTQSELTGPTVESTLLNFIADTTVPAQAIISEAQALLYSKLRVREMRSSTTFNLTVGLNTIALPGAATGDFLEPITLHDDTDGIALIPNDERFVSERRLLQLRTATQGIPQHVSIFNEAFQFDAPANGTIAYTLVYYKRPPFLTSPSASNFLTARYPHIFRAAAQVALANFKHDAAARVAAMQTLDALTDAANKEADLVDARGTRSELTAPAVESTLLNFIADSTVPAQVIITEAQAIIYSMLRVREMRQSATFSLTTGLNNIALPGSATGDYLETITLHDDTDSIALIPSDERFVSERRLLQLRTAVQGIPQHVSIFNEAFQFDAPANGTINYTVVYYKRPTFLTSPTSSNFLTLRYPHIFRAGAQVALANLKHDAPARAAAMETLKALVDAANKESDLVDARGTRSDLIDPRLEGSLLSFIGDSTVPVQQILLEAQATAYSRLRVREMRVSTSLTLTAGTNTIALPGAASGQFLEPIALYDATGTVTFIPSDERFVSQQRMLQLQGAAIGSGVPKYVSIYNENLNFDVNASPQQTFTLVSYQRPANLTSPSQSNWFTLRYPQIFRAAAQVALADYKRDLQGRAAAEQILVALCDAANKEAALLDSGVSDLNKPAVEGSLLSFIPSATTPVQQVLAEAQQLLYGILRCREMMTETSFTMPANGSYIALPARFLDPIGPIQTTSFNNRIKHKDSNYIQSNRNYTEQIGTLGTNPFTTATGSVSVTVNLANHGFTQDSVFECSGATAVNGVTINGTFPVSSIVDANNFVIDITSLGATPTGSGAGGGTAVNYICDVLTQGTPYFFGIWNERINFEQAFFQPTICKMQYYQSLPLLTSQDQSNFLTTRYPQLFRLACQAAEANMRRDRKAYDSIAAELIPLVSAVNAENDMQYRGLELDPEIP